MKPEVAKALEGLVGPLVAGGLSLGISEAIAKLGAFEAGTYPGEQCSRCVTVQALLHPWGPTRDFPGEPIVGLCEECSRKEALWRDMETRKRRIDEASIRESQDGGA